MNYGIVCFLQKYANVHVSNIFTDVYGYVLIVFHTNHFDWYYISNHSSLALYLYIKYIHSLHIIHGLLTNKVWIGFNFFDSIKETLNTLRKTMQYKKYKTLLSSLKVISNVFHHCFWRRSMKMIWNICNLTKSQAFYRLGPITIQLADDRYECKNILIFRIC